MRPAIVVIVAVFAVTILPAQSDEPQAKLGHNASLAGKRIFPADNPWNQDISEEPVDANSDAIVARIGKNKPLRQAMSMASRRACAGWPRRCPSWRSREVTS